MILTNHESHDSPNKPLLVSDKNLQQGPKILSVLSAFYLIADLTEPNLLVLLSRDYLKITTFDG